LAHYEEAMPAGALQLLRYIPADSQIIYGQKLGDLSGLMAWYAKLMEASELADADDAELDAFHAMMEDWEGQIGDEFAMSFGSAADDTLALVMAARIRDPASFPARMRHIEERMVELMEMEDTEGLRTSVDVEPDLIQYKGHAISQWRIAFDLTRAAEPPDGPAAPDEMTGLAKGLLDAMFGADLRAHYALVDDVCIYALGADSLDTVKAAIDGGVQPPAELQAVMDGIPGRPLAVGSMAFEGLMGSYVRTVGKVVAAMGEPFGENLTRVRFPEGPPVTMAAWINEDGSVCKQVRIPTSIPANVVAGFSMIMLAQPGGIEEDIEQP
jgi:hypothetical protein